MSLYKDMEGPVTVDVATSLLQFQQLRDQWDSVVNGSPGASVYVSYTWLEKWWENFGRDSEIHCLLVRDQAGPFGVVPLMQSYVNLGPGKIRILRLVGNNLSPRSEILLQRRMDEAWVRIYQYMEKLSWCYFDYGRGDETSEIRGQLLNSNLPMSIQLRESFELPLVSLEASWDDWLAEKSRTFRKSLRKTSEKCKGLSVSSFPKDFNEPVTLIGIIETIERESWSYKEGSSFVSSPSEQEFIRTIIQDFHDQDALYAVVLMDGERPAAYALGVRHAGTVFGLKTGYGEAWQYRSIGMHVMAILMKDCMLDDRCLMLDMDCVVTHGDYKRRWANEIRQIVTHRVFRRTVSSWLLSSVYRLKKRLA